jgi:hypothetical protein
MTTALTSLTEQQIVSVIDAMPHQGRIMLRLLLLQYLDTAPEDVDYMAADRPDPRMQAGAKPTVQSISREDLEFMHKRVAQYRASSRQKRERVWLQMECLRKQLAIGQGICEAARKLLTTRYGAAEAEVQELRDQARIAIPKPAIRELDQKWDRDEISEEDYRARRIRIEYQTELRRIERDRRRLEVVTREYALASSAPLQDHEIAHIWGIPHTALTGRKVKYLHQYLQSLQQELAKTLPAGEAGLPPIDLWRETFAVLSRRPAERSAVPYDWTERTEGTLTEKITALVARAMTEDQEARQWITIIKSLFALQRLLVILNDQDTSPEGMEAALLARVSPTPKLAADQPGAESAAAGGDMSEWKEHVLKSMYGEGR